MFELIKVWILPLGLTVIFSDSQTQQHDNSKLLSKRLAHAVCTAQKVYATQNSLQGPLVSQIDDKYVEQCGWWQKQDSSYQSLPCVEPEPYIGNGQNALKNEFPETVYVTSEKLLYPWRCGGTILAAAWIITAGHCSKNSKDNNFKLKVIAGAHQLSKPDTSVEQIRYVEPADMHLAPGYIDHPDPDALDPADLSLLHLKKPLDLKKNKYKTRAAILPSVGPLTLVGWGIVNNSNAVADILQKITIPRTPCLPTMAKYYLCADKKNKGPCTYDSGPSLVESSGGTLILAATHVGGSRSCIVNGVSIDIHLIEFKDWIEKTTGGDVKFPKP